MLLLSDKVEDEVDDVKQHDKREIGINSTILLGSGIEKFLSSVLSSVPYRGKLCFEFYFFFIFLFD